MVNFRIPKDSSSLLQILRGVRDWAEVEVTLYTRIREVLSSNLGQNTGYSYAFRGFP
jgi:hypothetical protein